MQQIYHKGVGANPQTGQIASAAFLDLMMMNPSPRYMPKRPGYEGSMLQPENPMRFRPYSQNATANGMKDPYNSSQNSCYSCKPSRFYQ